MSILRGRFVVLGLLICGIAGCDSTPWPTAPVTRETVPAGAGHPDRVTVAPGDTLYGLAQRYHVPVRSVIDANDLVPPYRLAAGTVLVLPQQRIHVVRPGETLAGVARQHGVDVSSLARLNRLAPPYVIRSGQALALPAPVEIVRRVGPPLAAAPASPPLAPPRPALASAPPEMVARATLPPPVPSSKPEPKAAPMPAAVERPLARAEPSPPPAPPAAAPEAAVDAPVSAPGFIWPVHGKILANFGPGDNGAQNEGINLAAPAGTPVLAAAAGTVAYAGNELRGYGNLILIKHANGLITAYAHNGTLLVKRGDVVRRGEPIARVGATGAVTEPQLHFEIRRGTRALDPASYLPTLSAAAGG